MTDPSTYDDDATMARCEDEYLREPDTSEADDRLAELGWPYFEPETGGAV